MGAWCSPSTSAPRGRRSGRGRSSTGVGCVTCCSPTGVRRSFVPSSTPSTAAVWRLRCRRLMSATSMHSHVPAAGATRGREPCDAGRPERTGNGRHARHRRPLPEPSGDQPGPLRPDDAYPTTHTAATSIASLRDYEPRRVVAHDSDDPQDRGGHGWSPWRFDIRAAGHRYWSRPAVT